ncbi:MAG: hypothetical protein V4564_02600 [Pseudomonadota bacterium]|uniref:hypothetical protein n=1 Tax=Sphingomonas sp. ERG5 TaxID=1381597 RepID=UPI00054C55C4|nr:hypothetical protein [Sphingomonas sp. ERG5]
MKTLSRVALAAILIASTSSVAIVAPAYAKKKEEAKAPGLQLSKEAREFAIKIDEAARAREAAPAAGKPAADAAYLAALDANLPGLEGVAKSDDELYIAQAYRFQYEALKMGDKGNENVLAGPLDKLLANPKTPKDSIGRYAFMRGNIAYNAKQYPVALSNYAKAKEAGYASGDLPLLMAKAKILGGDAPGGIADIEAVVTADKAAGKPVSEDLYTYAITALQKTNDNAAVQRWTRNWLHSYGTPKNWRTAIYVFGFQGAGAKRIDKKQRVDLFRLMRATNGLAGQDDYLEYAELTFSIGLGSETITVLDEGKKNGKIPASSTTATQFRADAVKQIGTEGSLAAQETKANAAKTGAVAADTGDFCLGSGNYAKAIEMYRLALTKGSVDADEVNTHLGIALTATGDKAGAKAAFALVKNAPRNEIATLWTTWIDAPAGAPAA